MLHRLIGITLIAGSFAVAWFLMTINDFSTKPLSLSDSVVAYELPPGTSLSTVANDLEKRGYLDSALLFKLLVRWEGQASKIKAGEYELHSGITPKQLITLFVSGKVKSHTFTIVEGWTFKDLVSAIRQHKSLKQTLEGLNGPDIMVRLGYPDIEPEGRFLPDTYHFPKGTTDVDFLRRAYKSMEKILADEWLKREEGLPLKTPYEALILASIVEKESAIAEERTQIAGVFINRLRKGMRLQTDPTVIYGIGDKYKGNIRFKHLRTDTPYNTYTRKGLPPTPIAMPGQGALDAVSHPDTTEYIYFVAMSDKSGRHIFSTTLKDHEHAVDVHQRKLIKKAR
ncbi:MAG: endolytic transglycosylase MltG [Sedimenticola sp.]|nr:endolytic transglycosylase MltG [Sedimenticola sp.]